jgi:DNA-binding transcriptional LysR family regulator
MRTIVCAAASLLRSHRALQHPTDLAALPCVSFDRQAPAANWTFRDPGSGNPIHVPITPRLSTTTAEAAVAAAACGTGATRVYAYQADDAVRSNRLEIILPEFEIEPTPVHLIHAGRELLPLKTRVFLTFATSRLRVALA